MMTGITTHNPTPYRAFISIFVLGDAMPVEWGWIEPGEYNEKAKAWTGWNYVEGNTYQIQSKIEDKGLLINEFTINVMMPCQPLILKTDGHKSFWWEQHRNVLNY